MNFTIHIIGTDQSIISCKQNAKQYLRISGVIKWHEIIDIFIRCVPTETYISFENPNRTSTSRSRAA